jgi:PPOX class probable F420-dependent enzyme
MNLDEGEARRRFTSARVARLATAGADGRPHLVPVTFALRDGTIGIAVDHKPKRSPALRRLANIAANPQVSLLADEYDEDWSRLWWVRADGAARVVDAGSERTAALDALTARYEQYRAHRPDGPVILVAVDRWTGWAYSSGR